MSANILLLDIETSPILGYTWRKWQTDLLHIVRDWQLLMVGYKWLGDRKCSLMSGRRLTEKEMCEDLWDLLNKADIVVAHNGNRFDIKKIQAKLKEWGCPPPSPFKSVDTCAVAKAHFGFTSNKLDDLGQKLGVGRKMDTGGMQLWLDVMEDCQKAWTKMENYCKQDVDLLEQVYLELRPWMPRHPNMAVFSESREPMCAVCSSHDVTETVNRYYTNSSAYRKYQCNSCGAWSRLRKADGLVRPSTIMADRK